MALDIVLHMTQKANPVTLLASPLGEEGHEVAKGCTVVRMIMILDVDVTAEGGINYKTHRPQGDKYEVSVTGLAVCVICDTISSATYFLVSP